MQESVNGSDVVPKLTKYLVIDDSLFDEHSSQKKIKCNIIKATIEILASFASSGTSSATIITDIVHALFLSSSPIVSSLLIHPPDQSLIIPTLDIFAKVCANCPSPVLSQLAACSACEVIPDLLNNAHNMQDYESFLLCLAIVQSTGSHAPPTSTVGRSSITTMKQALEKPGCPEVVRKVCARCLIPVWHYSKGCSRFSLSFVH